MPDVIGCYFTRDITVRKVHTLGNTDIWLSLFIQDLLQGRKESNISQNLGTTLSQFLAH